MASGGKRARPPDEADGEAAEDKDEVIDEASLTPLQRELLHTKQERDGLLTFPIISNDATSASVTALVQLKAIYYRQLPKMPKEYISRLVLDRRHVSLACCMKGEIVGGITYRPVQSQALSEIVFCAVSADHQVQGYGTRIMNQIKEECKRTGIEGMLTYADNHAVGYFRKQGFKKNVTMKRDRWQGYLKDYEGATLMECVVDPTIDYLSTRQVAEQQRRAVVQKVSELEGADATHSSSSGASGAGAPTTNGDGVSSAKDVLRAGWPAPVLEVRYRGVRQPVQQCLETLFEAVSTQEDAWPFRQAVSRQDAPDYHEIVKNPVDLSMMRERLFKPEPRYYVTPDQLLADLYVMYENCRLYNPDTTVFWECATRLEAFTRNRAAELEVLRKPREN